MCNESAGQREYLRALRRSKRFVACMRWGILIVAVLLWEALARFGLIDAFLLSSPSRMISALLDLVKTGELWLHVGTTLAETLLGFVIGSVYQYALFFFRTSVDDQDMHGKTSYMNVFTIKV